MVRSNGSIHDCSNSRNKTKGLEIFRNPTKDDEYSKNWHNALVQIITKDRAVDNPLREQIAKILLYSCELCYR